MNEAPYFLQKIKIVNYEPKICLTVFYLLLSNEIFGITNVYIYFVPFLVYNT